MEHTIFNPNSSSISINTCNIYRHPCIIYDSVQSCIDYHNTLILIEYCADFNHGKHDFYSNIQCTDINCTCTKCSLVPIIYL